jgi:hypothetical protein
MDFYQEGSFKRLHDVEIRTKLCQSVNPNVLVIVEQALSCTTLPLLRKTEFTVTPELPISSFITEVRDRLKLNPLQPMFLTSNGNLLTKSARIASFPKDADDGAVYLVYTDSIVGQVELLEASGGLPGGSMWWSEPINSDFDWIKEKRRRQREKHLQHLPEDSDKNFENVVLQAAERRSMLERKKKREVREKRIMWNWM